MPTKRSRKQSKSSIVKESSVNNFKQPKFFVPAIIVLLIILAFVFKGLFVVALVNGQPITRLALIKELEKQGGKQTLAALVNQTLILQEAKKKNIDVSNEEVEKSAKEIEDSLTKQGQNLDTALAVQGMTRQDFLMQLKLRALVEKLLAGETKVTDQEVTDYIEKNKDTFSQDMKEEEVRQTAEEQLKQEKLAAKSGEWLNGLLKNAKINYFVNY